MSTNFFWTDEGLAIARTLAADEQARRPPGDERHSGKSGVAGASCERCARWIEDPCTQCPRCAMLFAEVPVAQGFTWAQDPEVVGGICRAERNRGALLIVDEDERGLACEDFVLYLQRCVRRHVMDLLGVPHWC